MERQRRTALKRTSMTLLKTASAGSLADFIADEDVTPTTASKNKGRINNISDDERGRQIVYYDSEDEEEDCNKQQARKTCTWLIIFKNTLLLLFMHYYRRI